MSITATQLAADLRKNFDHDVTMAKRRKETLRTPSVKDGFKTLAKVLKKAAEFDSNVNHNVYVYANAVEVDADIFARTESLKSPGVAALIEYVEKVVAPAYRSEDYASSSMAQRTFVHQGNGLRLNLIFRLPTDGDACSRVKVGTKLVEQDTYEIRCQG